MRTQGIDALLDICKKQGYVPKDCQLDGRLVYALMLKSEDPCAGCNLDRKECGGRPNSRDRSQTKEGL